jgi:DNA excision repair protein ERCC-2
MGGIFGEGIDLPGEQLIGVSVVSLGLPPFDDFHEQLAQKLQQRYGQGYEYTYLYPAIRKIIQAAGRLIRHHTDTGCIELIDQRFKKIEIKRLFPAWWFEKNQPTK